MKSIHLALPLTFDFQAWVREQPDRDKNGYENVGKRWSQDEESAINANLAKGTWKLEVASQELSGKIEDDRLIAVNIDWSSDGSGRMYSDILLPLFREFKGNLEALVVWEHGDAINRLTISNGAIEDTEIA